MMFDGWNPHSFGVSFMEIQMFFGDFMFFFYGISMGIYDGIIYIYIYTYNICISSQLKMVSV